MIKRGTALVTGGSRRIGAAIARDLAAHGFAAAVHYNSSPEDAEALARSICADGGTAAAIGADLEDPVAAAGLVTAAEAALGPVTLVVNNASVFEDDCVTAFDLDQFERHFAVHLKAPSLIARAMAERLAEDSEGLIVNMIDQRVLSLTPRFYSYTLSKSALWTATRTMAQALAPRIRVNAIGPGPTLPNERQSQADFDRQVEGLLLKREPALEEFGATIRWMWENRSLTGQIVALDGGQHLAWETPDVAGIAE